MPLPPSSNRRFVIGFVALMLALSALATVLILRGWSDEGMQERVRQMEDRRR